MKRENVNYTVVGMVALLALGMLVLALFLITGRRGAVVDYLVRYRNVTGLAYGAPVYYEGFRIGQVEHIAPERAEGKTRYRVRLVVRRDWPIPRDSVARLTSTGLLGDIAVSIREGSAPEVLPPGATLAGEEGGDVFAAFNELAGEITTLTRSRIRPLIETLSTRVDSIAQTVDTQAPLLLVDAQALLKRLNQAADSVNGVLSAGNRAHIDQTLANMRHLSEDLRRTQDKLDALLGEGQQIAAENRPAIRDAIQDLSQITTALARRIDAIAHNLESSSRNLDEFSREIRKNPNRILLSPKKDEVRVEDE